ncbi:MAG: hypothetical protein O2968_06700 [Acidobacteria bacterium]|nr:hypothetical protein [Acidobacteriota bacterium]
MTRRTLLASTATLAVSPLAGLTPLAAAAPDGPPKRIAAVITTWFQRSHADVIVGKYLEGFHQDGQPPYPRSKIVSMYTAQVHEKDLSREMSRKHGVPIYRTIYEALTLGTGELAVDGVLIIGEHGDYPLNDKGQRLYPRFQLFLQVTDVFRQTGKAVPVYTDKHLSYSWAKAKRTVEISREMGFPMLAGSSVPVAFRDPLVDAPWGAKIPHAVGIAFAGLESYGFHMLELIQSMIERRQGGEVGVSSVQCLQGDAVWKYLDATPWVRPLFNAALSRCKTRQPGELTEIVKNPAVFLVNYRDGAQAAGFMLTGAVKDDFAVAVEVEGRREPVSPLAWLMRKPYHHHFGCLIKNIEKMYETGNAPYPVERTLLVSGILDFMLDSVKEGNRVVETPELGVVYQTPNVSHFCTEGWA